MSSSYSLRQSVIETHDLLHRVRPESPGIPTASCIRCFPPPALDTLSLSFTLFWTWFKSAQPAETYSSETVRL